jgi:hypothetical protein
MPLRRRHRHGLGCRFSARRETWLAGKRHGAPDHVLPGLKPKPRAGTHPAHPELAAQVRGGVKADFVGRRPWVAPPVSFMRTKRTFDPPARVSGATQAAPSPKLSQPAGRAPHFLSVAVRILRSQARDLTSFCFCQIGRSKLGRNRLKKRGSFLIAIRKRQREPHMR